ncbi:MAG: rod shape-determining protein RodA [Spirochaeta sp.]|jgi:rod shape determining protein RodA|nr:rod shape-determining protein RodA [Spirochaeta sp.]
MSSRSIFEIDLYIASATVALMTVGVLFIFSSGVTASGQVVSNEYIRQILWAASGLVLLIAMTFIDYRELRRPALGVFAAVMGLLVLTLAVGRVVNGARSWIGIGPFGVQPSEFAKIALILILARYYAENPYRARSLTGFLGGLGITAIPTVLVLLQPDLGSAMVYFPIFLFVAFAAGARGHHLAFFGGTGALVALFTVLPVWDQYLAAQPIAFINALRDPQALRLLALGLLVAIAVAGLGLRLTQRRIFFWLIYVFSMVILSIPVAYAARRVLQEYQIMRLIVFIDPYVDPRGAGWNIIQSVTAVGSGGLFGKGYLQGTQSHYQYLPQQSTDFIFSILAEEWGFVGVVVVILLFMIIIFRGIYIMASARDRFASIVSAGLVGLFFFHFMVNVGMAVGIMPITGIPLYLVSYGGSSLWTALIGIGMLMSIYQHRSQY